MKIDTIDCGVHTIYFKGNRAVCPDCSGLLTKQDFSLTFNCIDCNSRFIPIEFGNNDKELKYRQVRFVETINK